MYRDIIIKESSGFFEDCSVPLVADDVGAYRICMKLVKYADARCIKVTAMRSDGVTITDSVAIAGDTAYYIIARNMYAVEGKLNLRVSLLDGNNNALTTKIMTFDVLGEWENGVSGESNYPIIYEALATAQKAAKTAKDNAEEIEQIHDVMIEEGERLDREISERTAADEQIRTELEDIYGEVGNIIVDTNTNIIKLSSFSNGGSSAFDEQDIFAVYNDLGESVDALMYSGDASWVFSKTLKSGMCYALKIESKPVGGADWSNGEISVLAEAIYDETLGWRVNDLEQRLADVESGGIEGGTTSVSAVKQWVQNNYLPLSGGEMNKGSIIGIQNNTDSRKTILTSSGVKLIPSKSTEGSYAFGLSYRKTDDSDVIGGIGAFGTGDDLQYYYMGTYDNPLLKVSSSGSLAMKKNIYRPDYSFLLRYYQQSNEQVVAVKLGNFKTYDSKATIDILGRNLFNGKQAGGKYTLTLSFNSNATSGFNAGGILYYYGDFFGSTGNVDTTATPISVQLVQSEENRANCDVYILLNKPAQYPIFSIDVNCLSDTTWTKDVQWITDTADIPEVDGTTSYIVATKNVAFEDSTVDRAIADKNGDDITENYARLHNSSKTPYDTGRVWLNGEPIMRQDYCVVVKKGSTAWNDGSINYSDCINDSNTQYSGILQWTAFGSYTNVPTDDSGTYDINPIDCIRLNIDVDGRNIDFDISESAPYDCIVIAGYIEYVTDGADIPQSSITKIIE